MATLTAVSDVVTAERYFSIPGDAKPDAISGEPAKKLKYYAGGVWRESKTSKFMPCYDPSTGAVIAMRRNAPPKRSKKLFMQL